MEVEKKPHITNLLSTKKLFNLNVKISLHGSLNTSKGVIRCQDLGPCTDDDILENLKSEGVIHIRNIQVRRNGVLKRTNAYVLTFNTPILPKKIKAAYLSVNVEVYIRNPLRCYNCPVFGHHEDNCLKKPICGNCGGEKHCSVRNCGETPKCANCNGNHPGSSRYCPSWKKEKQILTVKYQRSITFFEARKIVEEQISAPGKSYASITKGAGVKCTDAQTQTDETYNVQLTSTASGGGPTPKSGQNAGGGLRPTPQTSVGGGPCPALKPSSVHEKNKDGASSGRLRRDQNNAPKKKIDTDRVSKGSDDPIKAQNIYDALSEEGMEAETTPASPRKGHIERLPIS